MEQKPLDTFAALQIRKHEALEAIVPLAKTAAGILNDLHHPTTASEIAAQIFTIEALERDMIDLMRNHGVAVMDALMKRL